MTLAEQYKNVIADLEQAAGFHEEYITQAVDTLKTRLKELEEIWTIPDEEWVDPIDDASIAKWVQESFTASLENGTNVVDEMNERLSKFKQEEDKND